MTNKRSFENMVNSHLCGLIADGEKINHEIDSKRPVKASAFKNWKLTVVAACMVLILSLTVLASGLGYFDVFFQDKAEIISDKVAEVNKSVENNGIVFHVESAYTTESGGLIAGSFTKKDGTIFGNESHDGSPLYNMYFQVYMPYEEYASGVTRSYKPRILPYAAWRILSDDSKSLDVLFVVPKAADGKSLAGQKVKLTTTELKGPRKGAIYEGPWEIEVTMPKVDESSVFQLNFKTLITIYEANKTSSDEECSINSISFTPMGLFAKGTGRVQFFSYMMKRLKYELKDVSGEFPIDINEATQSCTVVNGTTYYQALFTEPINIKDIEYLVINEEETPLK